MTIKRFDLLQPTTLDEAVGLLEEHADEASLIAGGTALLIMLRERVYQPPYLIDLKTVPGLDQIRHEPGVGLRLGALVCHRDVELSPLVRERQPVLAEAYVRWATCGCGTPRPWAATSPTATTGSDPPCVLVACTAGADRRPAGQREVPAEEFFLGLYATALEPGEILTEVVVPDPPPRTHAAYLKYTSRSAMDWPCLGVAAAVTLAADGTCEDLRLVPPRCPSSRRSRASPSAARGQRLTAALMDEVGQATRRGSSPLSDIRGSEWYRAADGPRASTGG